MSDDIKYIDVDDEQFEDAPKALRDAYKALARQHKEVTTEAGQLRQKVASYALGDVLGTAGFKNPKRVEKDLLRDGIDATDKDAVEAWLAENSDDYAKAEGQPGEPDPHESKQELTPEQQQAADAFAKLQSTQGSLRQPAELTKLELAKSEITPDMTKEQVREVLLRHVV